MLNSYNKEAEKCNAGQLLQYSVTTFTFTYSMHMFKRLMHLAIPIRGCRAYFTLVSCRHSM